MDADSPKAEGTRHLTLTGFYAGQPFCGAPRLATDRNVHYAYAPEWMLSKGSGTCAACLLAVDQLDEPD